MLARVAEHIYWMSRYIERADDIARFLDVNIYLKMEVGSDNNHAQWEPLVRASGDEALYLQSYDDFEEQHVLKFLALDEQNDNSMLSSIARARENARTIREVIPDEQWEALNELYHQAQQYRRKRSLKQINELLKTVKITSNLCSGYAHDIMLHDEAWDFYQLGKLLERADKTLRVLDIKYFVLFPEPEYVGTPYDAIEWGAVLKSLSGFQMYRQEYHRVHYKDVSNFLIFDPRFPRSFGYCIQNMATQLGTMLLDNPLAKPVVDDITSLQSSLANTNVEGILRSGLHEQLDSWQTELNELDNAIHQAFFQPKPKDSIYFYESENA